MGPASVQSLSKLRSNIKHFLMLREIAVHKSSVHEQQIPASGRKVCSLQEFSK